MRNDRFDNFNRQRDIPVVNALESSVLSKIPAYEYLKQESASALGVAEIAELPVVFVPMEGGVAARRSNRSGATASFRSSSPARRTRIRGRSFSFRGTPFGLPASSWPLGSTASGDAAPAHPRSAPIGEPGTLGDNGSYFDTGRNSVKIGIVGAGQVGATAAYSMMMRRVGSEIMLVDRNADLAVAQARDILDATPFADPVRVRAAELADLDGARVVVLGPGAIKGRGRAGWTCSRATLKSSQRSRRQCWRRRRTRSFW